MKKRSTKAKIVMERNYIVHNIFIRIYKEVFPSSFSLRNIVKMKNNKKDFLPYLEHS